MLGQDQDSLGGDLDAEQSFSGKIGYFNMWDRILTEAEIVDIHTCRTEVTGNRVAWNDTNWNSRYIHQPNGKRSRTGHYYVTSFKIFFASLFLDLL